MYDISSLPITAVDNWQGSVVVRDYDEEARTGRVVEYGLSKEDAQAKANKYNMVYCDENFTAIVSGNETKSTHLPPTVEASKYCSKCGNTGTFNGEVCDCVFNPDTFFSTVSCMSIPEQYRGLTFNTGLFPLDVDIAYREMMQDLYTNISTARLRNHNYLICSPHKHGKTILAYTCIERLFRAEMSVIGVYDVMELRRMLNAFDMGKTVNDDASMITTSAYLFVKIPMYPNWEVFDTISTLLSRRVRSGVSTIFLYSGKYSTLAYSDKQGYLASTKGDGSFGTIDVKEWYPRRETDAIDLDNSFTGGP